MFTGLVESRGTVESLDRRPAGDGARLRVATGWPAGSLAIGDSIAVNGCCVTVVELGDGWFDAELVAETLRRTALGRLRHGDPVNLERPLAAGDRLGGHLVQGHVDGLGTVLAVTPAGDGLEVEIELDQALARYVVEKGSVAVDGVSLTVAAVGPDRFTVALVPHTLSVTTLGERRPGDAVQLEVDVLAKYVERLAGPYLAAATTTTAGTTSTATTATTATLDAGGRL
jgi:riboflavin synthase